MTLAFRRSNVNAMTATQKKLMRWVAEKVDLGDPAEYQTGANVVWYIFDDGQIGFRDIVMLARLAALLGTLGDFNTRAELRAALEVGVVWQPDVWGQTADPYQAALTANGAPTWVRAASGIPSGLTALAA
jgi:hypothetical protein